MTTTTKALIGMLVTGIAGMVTVGVLSMSGSGCKAADAKGCQVGQRDCLPNVQYTDVAGTKYTPSSLEGKIVIVNFWATWCKPCLKEIPDLSKVYEKHKSDGLVMLGVMMDDPDNQALLNFQSDNMMSYPVVRVNSDIMASYDHPSAMPTTFIYDRRGKRVAAHVGPLSEQQLAKYIEPLFNR